nr:hypothetical protein [Tanacetum cinerariifolium]
MFDCDEYFTSESDNSLPPSLIYDRYQSGDGYHVVPPPYTETFMPPKPDLIFHNAPNVNETIHTAFNVKLSPTKPDNDLSHTHRPLAPIIEDWVSDSEDDSKTKLPQNVPSFVQPTEHVKTPKPSVQHVETSILVADPKTVLPKTKIHRNHKNRKEFFVCKSLTYLIKDCDYHDKKMAKTPARNPEPRGNHHKYANITLPNPQRHVAPPAVLTKSKLVPITAVRPVNVTVLKSHLTRPRPAKPIVTKPHLQPRTYINRSPSPKASNFPPKVTAVKVPHVNATKGVQGKWEWKPKCLILDHVSCNTSASMTLKRFDYNDALGRSKCSRHMTGNMSYLPDFEELNVGYVVFGGNPKGGNLSGKGKIRTGKLDFDDVYFVKELKFNLFSVSQIVPTAHVSELPLLKEFALLNKHYALWEVIEFGDSYQAPPEESGIGSASESSAKKKGRTVAITTKDMQKRRNDGAILKTFGGNEATKKTKKNQLKQHYGNFKAEGSETLEQTFNKLQAIVSHLEFMDVEIKQDDLNQKFLTSLAPEWLMYTIVRRNRGDLDTLSLDDVYNHLKVYEPEVQKKSESNSQNMAFISSANTNSGKGEVYTAADRFCKKTGKKITIQGTDVAGFDKSKVECFNCHKMGNFARECRASRSQDRGRRENYKQGSKEEEPTPKDLMVIDGIG